MSQAVRPQKISGRRRPRKSRRGPASGWVPNQHGAWAFVITPWLLGLFWALASGSFAVEHVVLFAFWLVGYFAFFALSMWLKSRFKPRYRRAVATYGAGSVVLGVVLLALRPDWWSWALVFAPVCTYALWLAYQRRDRDLSSGLATVVAACLLPLVMGSQGVLRLGGMPQLVIIALVCFGYFFGTVLYVKTVLRERGRISYVVYSVGWHVVCAAIALFIPQAGLAWGISGFFVAMAIRAGLVAWQGPLSGRRVSVKALGIAEFASTSLLVIVLSAGLLS